MSGPNAGRVAPSSEVELQVLLSSRRRCCICFGLHRDLSVKQGQLAHIDRNPANSAADNLAFMCLQHHDWFDTKPSQSKGVPPPEAKHYREELYNELRRRDEAEAGGAAAPALVVARRAADVAVAANDDLPQEQIKILQTLAIVANSSGDYIPERAAAAASELSVARFQNHAHQLHDRRFIYILHHAGGTDVKLAPPGARWLDEHGLMPE